MTIVEGPRTIARNLRAAQVGLDVRGVRHRGFSEVLTPGALGFVAELQRRFGRRRYELLMRRRQWHTPSWGFREETADLRADRTWRVASLAPGLEDRRCEITGPPTRTMTISALNSGAKVWMADFEDAMSPTWFNVIDGQRNLYDAIRRTIDYTDEAGLRCTLDQQTATIMMRPRGLHLVEDHLAYDGAPVAATFVDFGLFFFHNAQALIASGRGPYFYLPKLESADEARLWADVFAWAENTLAIAPGTIRATCLIETFPAAFEMTEILYALREYSAGLNAGRWDYLFSVIKSSAADPERLLPDREEIAMTTPFMRAYCQLLVTTCHERGAHAVGGMAAFVPNKADPEATSRALEQTRAEKAREAADGFDGSWVAHPGLVGVCTEVFDAQLGVLPHQIGRLREDVAVSAAELNAVASHSAGVTLHGVRTNVRVSLAYLRAWVEGRGAVAINDLMEDAATVEISRMQLWQWIHHGAQTDDGVTITRELVGGLIASETMHAMAEGSGADLDAIEAARDILERSCLQSGYPEYWTEYAYRRYLTRR